MDRACGRNRVRRVSLVLILPARAEGTDLLPSWNDGTLWPENPLPFQLLDALDGVSERVAREPRLRQDPMVRAALAIDGATPRQRPRQEGLTTEEFRDSVRRWLATVRHPRIGRRYANWRASRCWRCCSFCGGLDSAP